MTPVGWVKAQIATPHPTLVPTPHPQCLTDFVWAGATVFAFLTTSQWDADAMHPGTTL